MDRLLLFTFQSPIDLPSMSYAVTYARGLEASFFPGMDDPYARKAFRELSFQEFRVFTHWFISALNRLSSYMYHIATFSEQGLVKAVTSYKHLLTWEQVIELVAKILASDDLVVKQRLTLSLLDIMVGARHITIEQLFSESWSRRTAESLRLLPSLIADDYAVYAESVFEDLTDEICSGLLPSAVQGDLVELPAGKFKRRAFAAKYMGALRNTLHSYASHRGDDYSQFLLVSADRIPTSLPALVPVLFLSLLAQPTLWYVSHVFGAAF